MRDILMDEAMNLSVHFSTSLKRAVAGAISCGMLLALPACNIPRLRHADAAPGLPAEFKRTPGAEHSTPLASVVGSAAIATLDTGSSEENSSMLGVDQFYNDPLLTGLIHQALNTNRELKILEQEVQIARNEVLSRRGAYLPFVTAGADGGFDRNSLWTPGGAAESQLLTPTDRHFPDPVPNTALGLNFFWRLDIWRAMRNARDAAQLRYIAAGEKRNAFVNRLIAEVAENYYKLMSLDKRLENLNSIIELQEKSLSVAVKKMNEARGTLLPVQRFQAEVQKNQSEKLIIRQEIIEVENRINFLSNRFPQPVERVTAGFFDLNIHALNLGVPSQLLQNRPDIRQAERELAAAGLDVKVARAQFFPDLVITGRVGYEAFNPRYLFSPDALAANVAGGLLAPLINKKAIQADYLSANARQLECVYHYQRTVLNAFTEVVNRISMVENYRRSIEIKKQQLVSLEGSVDTATKLLFNAQPGVDYLDVLFAQRDLQDARMILIDTKYQQLAAIANTYQALGGGYLSSVHNPDDYSVQPGGSWGKHLPSRWKHHLSRVLGIDMSSSYPTDVPIPDAPAPSAPPPIPPANPARATAPDAVQPASAFERKVDASPAAPASMAASEPAWKSVQTVSMRVPE